MRKRVKLLGLSALPFIVIIGVLIFYKSPLTDFPPGTPGSPVSISISSGESGSQIAIDLARKGVILSSQSFFRVATGDQRSRGISPGVHSIDSHITSLEALNQLLDTKRNLGVIPVIEGSTTSDVLDALKQGGIKGEIGKVDLPRFVVGTSLEGALFPASYAFAEGTTRHHAIVEMVKRFDQEVEAVGLKSGFQKYSAYDVLKIASLIQIEADPADYAKAARVIYNRLAISMPLQLNSTVQYAIHTRGHITLTRKETAIASAYNTYLHTGLPPTPISNPGRAALLAALHPVAGDWLYFITVKPHETRFTKSFAQFDSWVTIYNNNVANGLFK
jgi:UPF0755 protein